MSLRISHTNRTLVLAASALSVMLASCALPSPPPARTAPEGATAQQPAAPAQPTRLVMRTLTDPDNLDPHLSAASLTQQIMLNVFEGLELILKMVKHGHLTA